MLSIQKLENKLLKIFVVVSGVTLLTPLFLVKNILRPYILTKALSFQSLVLVLAAIWVVLMAIDWKKYRPKMNLLSWLTMGFVLIVFLSSIFGLDFGRSFWGNAERMDGFLALLHFYVFFLSLFSVLKNRKEMFRNLIFVFLASGFFSVLYVILQKIGMIRLPMGASFARPDGLFGNPTFLSGYALVNLFLGIWYYLTQPKWGEVKKMDWQSIFVLVFIFFNVIGLVWTQTRGSWLGLILAFIVFLIASIFVFSKRTKILAGSILVLMILLIGLFIGFKDQIRYSSLAENVPLIGRLAKALSADDSSGLSRLHSWGWSIDWAKERPILGVGQDMFYNVFDRNYDPNNIQLMNERFDRAHNKFIDVLVMNGVLGLISYLLLLLGMCWVVWKKVLKADGPREKIAWLSVLSLIVAYSVHNFFVFDTPGNSIAFFFILTWLAAVSYDRSVESSKSSSSVKILIAGVGAILLGGLIFYKVNYLPYKAARISYEAETVNPPSIVKTFGYYQEAISKNTFLNSEIRKMWSKHFLNFLIYTQQKGISLEPDLLKKLSNDFSLVIQEGIEEEEMIDFYIYPATIYAQLAWRPESLTDEDREYYLSQSEKWFEGLVGLWPGRVDYYMIWPEDNFIRGNYKRTEYLLKDILDKTPDYGRAILLNGALKIAEGDFSAGVSEIAKAIDKNVRSNWEGSNILNALLVTISENRRGDFLDAMDKEFESFRSRDGIASHKILSFATLAELIHSRLESTSYQPWLNYLEIYLDSNPNDADSWARLAALYGRLRNKEGAIFAATKAVEISPEKYGPNYKFFVDLIQKEEWDKLK